MSDLHNSADEPRRDYIVGALKLQGAMYEDDARAYLAEHDAAHRAEVLNKAITSFRSWTGTDGVPIEVLGMDLVIRRLESLVATGETEKASATAPTATPDFFQPGHGYTHRSYGNDFHCVTVTTHPTTGERLAMGWLSEQGEWHRPAVVGINQWNHEYDAIAEPAAPEPVLNARQERLLAEMRRDDTPDVWSTGPAERLYRSWRVPSARHKARRDLAALAVAGHLTRHGDDTGRRYRLNTRKDGVASDARHPHPAQLPHRRHKDKP